jgi:superfamily I DNA/RNA helicase
MYLPKLDDLIDEQRDIYEAPPDVHLFVAGPPGSGKTSLAVWRAKQLVELGQSVILITKNRMLVALAQQLSEGVCDTATMNYHITRDYSQRIGGNTPEYSPFQYIWQQVIQTYTDRGISRNDVHMIIDEGQNLPLGFFQWAIQFGAHTLTVFADERQMTDSGGSTLHDIYNTGLPQPIRLTTNHRNSQEIARVAEYFHRSTFLPPAIVRRDPSYEKPMLESFSSWDGIAQRIAARYINRKEAIGVIVRLQDDVNHMAVLLRTILPSTERVDSYISGSNNDEKILTHAPGITVLTSKSVIGLEFETVFLQDLHRSLPCNMPEQFRLMYMLCARARNSLILINGPAPLNASQIATLPDITLLDRQ